MTAETCALCANELPVSIIREANNAFCCPGCHTVFNILSSQNQLVSYQDSPVFKQAVKSGLISNPALLEQIRRKQQTVPDQELEKLHLEVSEMWCPACAEIIQLILLQEKGVRNCVVDYATDLASVEFSPRHISKERIFQLIESLGYCPALMDSGKNSVSFMLYLRFAIAAFCSLNIMMFAYPLYATYFDYDDQGVGALFAWLSLFTALPVLGFSAGPITRRFFSSLQAGLYGMETLVVIGVTTAFGLSLYNLLQGSTKVYFDSMTVIVTFVLLGKIIEAKAKFSAKDSLWRLSKAIPRRGRKRFTDGSLQFVPAKEIASGDTVVAFCGEKIILDGVVTEGQGTCDESLITGESIPVIKEIGSKVISGAILQNGVVSYRVTATIGESILQHILNTVQQEIGNKTVYVRAADRIVRWFVPIVLLVALATALICWVFGIIDPGKSVMETAVIRAISVLLISCPCAIGIAAPLAESLVISGLASLGAIVRNRGCLSLLGKETVYVFDKTGTITEGVFTVMDGLQSLTSDQKAMLKGLAEHSTHPIACAIAREITDSSIAITHIEEYAGKGLQGRCNADFLLLGSPDFMQQKGVTIPTMQTSATTVFFAINGMCIAQLILGDKIRPEVIDLIKSLAPAKTILLSGDSENSVAAVAHLCGFDSWKARCTPLEKRAFIESLRQKGFIVSMFGDGINDAPALTAAHIGFSVVSATDISIQVSDILLTTDRLQVIPKILQFARQGQKVVKQNLFWAFIYNVIGIGLAAFGFLSPIFAAFAMVASSLMVILNAKKVASSQ